MKTVSAKALISQNCIAKDYSYLEECRTHVRLGNPLGSTRRLVLGRVSRQIDMARNYVGSQKVLYICMTRVSLSERRHSTFHCDNGKRISQISGERKAVQHDSIEKNMIM